MTVLFAAQLAHENPAPGHYNLGISPVTRGGVLSAADSLIFKSHSAEETATFGVTLGKLLRAGDVICLSGPLGAGKTALTAGIARGWGALEPVNSPTFVFVHEHHRAVDAVHLYHVDCYRLATEDDALSIGIEDVLGGSDVVVVEWPERIASFLPTERLWIHLQVPGDPLDGDSARDLEIRATGARYDDLLSVLR